MVIVYTTIGVGESLKRKQTAHVHISGVYREARLHCNQSDVGIHMGHMGNARYEHTGRFSVILNPARGSSSFRFLTSTPTPLQRPLKYTSFRRKQIKTWQVEGTTEGGELRAQYIHTRALPFLPRHYR